MTETAAEEKPNELQAKVDELTQTLETQRAAADTRANATEKELAFLRGVMSNPAPSAPAGVEEVLDPQAFYADPQKALDEHFNKRARPFLDAQTQAAALTQRELVGVKRAKDWSKYQKEVDEIAAGMNKAVLANPGSYEGILDLVVSRHKDEIIKEEVDAKVKEAVASFQAEAARKAASSTPGPAPASSAKAEDVKFEDGQLSILKKLGIDPKRAADVVKDTASDGVLITGPGGVH